MTDTAAVSPKELRARARAWAMWDWGSAAFNAVVTTFVFSRYIASELFVDPAIIEASGGDITANPLKAALADNAAIVSFALAGAGIVIALLAPVMGQRSDGTGRRKLWMAINTFLCVAMMLGMFFVTPVPAFIWAGAALLALGNVFFEFASVNYNAMLHQVSTKENMGRVSGFGWGMGYVGGIVLLALLLVLFLFPIPGFDGHGVLQLPSGAEGAAIDVRLAIVASAIWFLVFSLPVLFKVPELPRNENRNRVGFFQSYAILWRTIRTIARRSPKTLLFLASSAIFRDGLAAIFTFGAILASSVFGFSATEVLLFAIAANVTAGIGTFVGGWADDRIGSKNVILISLIALSLAGIAAIFIETKGQFWIVGLILTVFVGPVQASARSFMARLSPEGREGEMFGLYATTGRAVSFLAPTLFGVFVAATGDTRFGIIGIVIVLLAGLVLLLPVDPKPTVINDTAVSDLPDAGATEGFPRQRG